MSESMRSDQNMFWVEYGLDEFINKLSKGMSLTGRIVEELGNNRYILRIWGYNLLTESSKKFHKNDVVHFDVRELTPKLVLDFSQARNFTQQNYQGNMDLFV